MSANQDQMEDTSPAMPFQHKKIDMNSGLTYVH